MAEEIPSKLLRRLSNVMNSLLAVASVESAERVSEKWLSTKSLEIDAALGDWVDVARQEHWIDTLFDAATHSQKLAELFYRERSLVGVPSSRWESSSHRKVIDDVRFFQQELEYLESDSNTAEVEGRREELDREAESLGFVVECEPSGMRTLVVEPAVPLADKTPPIPCDELLEGIEPSEPTTTASEVDSPDSLAGVVAQESLQPHDNRIVDEVLAVPYLGLEFTVEVERNAIKRGDRIPQPIELKIFKLCQFLAARGSGGATPEETDGWLEKAGYESHGAKQSINKLREALEPLDLTITNAKTTSRYIIIEKATNRPLLKSRKKLP